MTRIGLSALAAAVLASPASATPQAVLRVADLPLAVHAALKFEMADPGAPFQATDALVAGQRLPFDRMLRASRDGTTWTIDYESGGVSYSRHRAIVRLVDGKYVVVTERLTYP